MPTISLQDAIRLGLAVPKRQTCDVAAKPPRRARGTGVHALKKKRDIELREGVTSRPGHLRAMLPIHLVSESTAGEPVWARRVRRDNQKRTLAAFIHKPSLPALPALVKFTRYGKRILDSDNVVSSTKHVRDMLATLYGVNDGHNSPLQFDPVVGNEVYGEFLVLIEITSSEAK